MGDDIWTVKRILEWIEGYLAQHGDEKPRASAQWLVAEALGVSRMQLFLDFDRPLTSEERALLRDYTKRRAAGEPLQYITGSVDFRYLTLQVRPGVLIPRPETEVLVSEALKMLPSAAKPQDAFDEQIARALGAIGAVSGSEDAADAWGGPTANAARAADDEPLLVADICTGSGCIALSLASEHPRVQVVATDISPEACALACENRDSLGLTDRVRVIACDLGEGVDDDLIGTFDLVASNPPYIPRALLAQIPSEVTLYEPALALDGGPDGLDVYRRLLEWSFRALKPGGSCVYELHEQCLDEASILAEAAGFDDVEVVSDLAGKPRILRARKRSAV